MEHPESTLSLSNWLELLQDQELRRSMGSVAQEQAASLTIERNVQNTIFAYEKVIEDKT